jgi:hypothetical protein
MLRETRPVYHRDMPREPGHTRDSAATHRGSLMSSREQKSERGQSAAHCSAAMQAQAQKQRLCPTTLDAPLRACKDRRRRYSVFHATTSNHLTAATADRGAHNFPDPCHGAARRNVNVERQSRGRDIYFRALLQEGDLSFTTHQLQPLHPLFAAGLHSLEIPHSFITTPSFVYSFSSHYVQFLQLYTNRHHHFQNEVLHRRRLPRSPRGRTQPPCPRGDLLRFRHRHRDPLRVRFPLFHDAVLKF